VSNCTDHREFPHKNSSGELIGINLYKSIGILDQARDNPSKDKKKSEKKAKNTKSKLDIEIGEN